MQQDGLGRRGWSALWPGIWNPRTRALTCSSSPVTSGTSIPPGHLTALFHAMAGPHAITSLNLSMIVLADVEVGGSYPGHLTGCPAKVYLPKIVRCQIFVEQKTVSSN